MFPRSILRPLVTSRVIVLNSIRREVSQRQVNTNSRLPLQQRAESVVDRLGITCTTIRDEAGRKNYSTQLVHPVKSLDLEDIYPRFEDTFAHLVLEKNVHVAVNLVQRLRPSEDDLSITKEQIDEYATMSWKSREIPEIVEAFKRISFYAQQHDEKLTDAKYQRLLKYIIANCTKFTNSELSDVLNSITLWPLNHSRKDKQFYDLYKALDEVCLDRCSDWTLDENLYFCDHWYKLRLAKYSEFMTAAIFRLSRKPQRMTAPNLLQYMFYINTSRKKPSDMHYFEYQIEEFLEEFSLDELAVISMAFFKTESVIHTNKIIEKIVQQVVSNIDTIKDITLTALLKVLRYSAVIQKDSGMIWQLLVSTLPQLPRLSPQCMIHIVTTATKLRMFHPELLQRVSERFVADIEKARVKDMERILLGFTTFNFFPEMKPDFYEQIMKELRNPNRQEELDRYPQSLADCLMYLSTVNIYPDDLIATTLDPENRQKIYGPSPFELRYSIYVLDMNVEADNPNYTGPHLDTRTRKILATKKLLWPPKPDRPKLSNRWVFMLDVKDVVEKVLERKNCTYMCHLLPQHAAPDIVFCLDNDNAPVSIEDSLSQISLGDVKYCPQTPVGARWFAIVIGDRNIYCRDISRMRGKEFSKLRQLKKIGYTPLLIPWYEWTTENKKDYVKRLIFP